MAERPSRQQQLRAHVFARGKSNYGNPVPDLAAVTDSQNQNGVFDHFTEVADHKEIYSRTHSEDCVEIIEQATVGVGPQTWHG